MRLVSVTSTRGRRKTKGMGNVREVLPVISLKKKKNQQTNKKESDKTIQLLFGFWGNAVCKWSMAALSWREMCP